MTVFLVFDLDGTLYSFKHTGIGLQMRKLINAFLADEFNMTPEEADAYADLHYKKYGLTARGLQVERKVSQCVLAKYCGFVHQVDHSAIKYNPELIAAFNALRQCPDVQMWVMTNAIKSHAMASLAQMGLTEAFRDPTTGKIRIIDCFDQWSWGTHDHAAVCKPLVEAYEKMTEVMGGNVNKDTFVLVEDSIKNLDEPKKLGWKTVFLTDEREGIAETAKEHGHVVHTNIMDAIPDLLKWAKNE